MISNANLGEEVASIFIEEEVLFNMFSFFYRTMSLCGGRVSSQTLGRGWTDGKRDGSASPATTGALSSLGFRAPSGDLT